MVIEALAARHDRADFDCGESSLNVYLQRYGRQNEDRFLSRTYVALFPESSRIAGYYSLVSGSVSGDDLRERKLPRYPIPIIRLARLAVDKRAQGQGIGEDRLYDALHRCDLVSWEIGVYAVIVDALHEQASRFYQRFNFHATQDDPLCLYPTMAEVHKLNLVPQ